MNLRIKNKKYELPIFLPDATKAVTKSLDSLDLQNANVRGVVVNTYHLMTSPGVNVLKKQGGIRGFMNYSGLVVSDSGGWQVFSLIHRNKKLGKVTNDGVIFSVGGGSKENFSPQKSIQVQFEIGSDILICLDDFTPPDATHSQAKNTVERTLLWAKECKKEFEKQIKARKLTKKSSPLLFAVVQGGYFRDLRAKCAEELIKIGFDGYGYGGYVIDEKGELDYELSDYICKLLPSDKPKFALGFGRPIDIVLLFKMGWNIFDCTLPTRDARHRRLYTFNKNPKIGKNIFNKSTFGYIYIDKEKYKEDKKPLDKFCDCMVCQHFSRSYLRHLFKIKDTSAYRLATIHNLRIYTKIMKILMDSV